MINTSNIKLSIIIPCFNGDKYIGEAIESVVNQPHNCVEIIIVDDGSTDQTKHVISKYFCHENIRYIYQKNKGASAARNRGINESKGEYIAFLDADDVFLDNNISKKITLFEKNPEVSFIFSDFFMEDKVGKPYQHYKMHIDIVNMLSDSVEKVSGNQYIFNEKFFKLSFVKSIFPWTGTVMVRKQCFDNVGFFNEELRISEDEDMFLRLVHKYKVAYIDEPLSIYKNYRSSVTQDTEKYFLDIICYLKKYWLSIG